MTGSPYDVLRVSPTATLEEIHRAYRFLAKRWHPDRCPHDPTATRRLQAINAAYSVLAARHASRPATETVLWHASRDGESVVLTTDCLRHELRGSRPCLWEVARWAINRVALSPARDPDDAVVRIEASSSTHEFELPQPLAARLAEVLNARTE